MSSSKLEIRGSGTVTVGQLAQSIVDDTGCAMPDAYMCVAALVKRLQYDTSDAEVWPDAFIDIQTSKYGRDACAHCGALITGTPVMEEYEIGTTKNYGSQSAWDCLINLTRAFCSQECRDDAEE